MGIIAFICFFFGLLSFCFLTDYITNLVKKKLGKRKTKMNTSILFDWYEDKPLLFLSIGLVLIVMTFYTLSSEFLSIVFPNDLKYKPEGIYCYYVVDDSDNAYPAKIEKYLYEEDAGEDYYGNKKSKTAIEVKLLNLYIGDESYDFSDDPPQISSDEFIIVDYILEEEVEKSIKLKLTNDAAYCPQFGKGEFKINYFELILEVILIISEIATYIIIIYVNRKENV